MPCNLLYVSEACVVMPEKLAEALWFSPVVREKIARAVGGQWQGDTLVIGGFTAVWEKGIKVKGRGDTEKIATLIKTAMAAAWQEAIITQVTRWRKSRIIDDVSENERIVRIKV